MVKLYFIYIDGTKFLYGHYQDKKTALKWAQKKPVLFKKGLYEIV